MKQNRPLARAATWLDLKAAPYLLVSPYFILFAIFGLFPLCFTVWVSLHDWELAGDREWLGLQNYSDLVVDADFWNAVFNTLGMFVLATVPQLLLALMLANALNKRMRFRLLYRLGILVPMVTSIVAVAVVFGQLFARDYGAFNWLLGTDGLDWQAEKWTSWTAISVMVDWRWTGYNALIYLAAMQAIPRDLYEAASIDGASSRRQFWQITVPMLKPAIIFTTLTSTIGGLSLFTEPVMFAQGDVGGGSLGQFQTVAMYMYENAFRDRDYGYASAVAWMLFLLILLVSFISFLFTRRIGGAK
ncbi:sugar ABC transporter permease [Actinocorallia sp. A-T 12471]|uniref:carbohydrate ABC transporter permease n=1 Tax=Actinocorallia sp. A-T 12471 TaxID=3089813 RepID=UPI0029D1D6B8|nr:sugar ABC transporter permease [Actinocorallia sp. A-T 12471]MDX6743370.1 sugar ABC transporter permease [Actinocorallia sp. A-T 12471]